MMHLSTLLELARMGCREGPVSISSAELGKRLGCSQQTASRRMVALEEEGLITRELLPKGQRIRLSPAGTALLRGVYTDLKDVFEEQKKMHLRLKGTITSGFGEGRYYMERERYRKGFKKLLGFEPYPGTLNLKLSGRADVEARRELETLKGLLIQGFPGKERTFGDVKCFRARMEGIEGAVIMPLRSHYGSDILEVIAPVKVREALDKEDGEIVEVEVMVEK